MSTMTDAAQPARLSARTHELAALALSGEWGRELAELSATVPPAGAEPGLTEERRYARCIRLIAENAPLRILPGQRVVGSATLRRAAFHEVPVRTPDGKAAFNSVSHTTLGFDHALRVGCRGLRAEIDERLARGSLDERGRDLLAAMKECLGAAGIWHRRHLELLDQRIVVSTGAEREGYRRVRGSLARVPENPPENFREAVQALWFLFCFQRLCGNWPGLGRIDEMLGPLLRADLAAGRITLGEARELLAHFWINGCDWIGRSAEPGSGDAQHYQNIILAGVDRDGCEVANEVTRLVLDVVEELRISDFPVAVRVSPRTPPELLRRVAEVQRLGGGIVAVYNEDQIIASLVGYGYPLEEARGFTNDGCWEILVPGHTCFAYIPFDAFALLQATLGVTGGGPPADFPDFESLYAAFRGRLEAKVREIDAGSDRFALGGRPSALVSLLVRDCIERGRGYHDRGARYSVQAIHAGGLQDASNSLLAIRKLVYEERRLALPEFVAILRSDWVGAEALRREILSRFDFYGNDCAAADGMTRRALDDFLTVAGRTRRDHGVLQPPGVSTFGREIEWRSARGAGAAGSRSADLLATNFSPAPGTDRRGPTAVIKSHCSLELGRLANGTALELKIHPSSLRGESGLAALVGLLRAFVRLGGVYLQVDVVDSATLRDAQLHPEKYPHLAVRVSGWSARFATLKREWQDMIINRTEQR